MFHSYWIAALRNLSRHRWYAAISIVGLALGLSVALVTALVIRQELSYEHFIPGYQRIYLAASGLTPADRPTMYDPGSPGFIAAAMRRVFPEVDIVGRIADDSVRLRRGRFEAKEVIYWADPQIFHVLPLPTIRGDLRRSLERPDGIVITASIARKYFGDQNPIGQTLSLNGEHIHTVTAEIEDLPANATLLASGVFASGLVPYSGLSECDRRDIQNARSGAVGLCGLTFFRLRPGAHIARLQQDEVQLLKSAPPMPTLMHASVPYIALDDIHLFEGFYPGARSRLRETAAIGLLILFAACVVYVNLTTARAARRSTEVGVRKVCGADRGALMWQFLGESFLTVSLAALVALSLTELLLPSLGAFLNTKIQFDYWRHPAVLGWMAIGTVVIALLAGAYPALVLSAFQPKNVLKGFASVSGRTWARQALVIAQCAILIGLVAAALVIFRQRYYATHEALRLNTDQVLVVRSPCLSSLLDGLRALPGIKAAACSDDSLATAQSFANDTLPDGSPITVNIASVDFNVFELFGIHFAASVTGVDNIEPGAASHQRIINVALRRALGFASDAAALRQPIRLKQSDGSWYGDDAAQNTAITIAAVVPDFAFEAVSTPIRPTMYEPATHEEAKEREHVRVLSERNLVDWPVLIHIKLAANKIPETLAAIDQLWDRTTQGLNLAEPLPIRRYFLQDYIEGLYHSILRQAQLFALFSAIAVVLGCLGLLGLAAATAERRTKEIGIRKAMGAGSGDILWMLLRQFTLPVLWASFIAWPLAALLLNRWLAQFARHIVLTPSIFVLASALAFLISLLTVSTHAWRVASAKPIAALRYE